MDPLHPLSQMLASLNMFRQESVLTDVVFVVEGVKFAAHKAVLASLSPVFRAMFSTDMQESDSNTVNIDDSKKEAFSDFLDFIYTWNPTYLVQHTQQMSYLAHKYDIDFIAKACDEIVEKCLTEQNAIDYLFDAHLYKRSELKVKIYLFIKKHKRSVSASNSWKNLENNLELYNEMLQTFLDKDPFIAQPSHSKVTWTVNSKDDSHAFTASVFENGKIYRFVLELYSVLIGKVYNSKIRISNDVTQPFIDENLPITIKLSCRYEGAIMWESTTYWTWSHNSTEEFCGLKSYRNGFPYDLTLSLESTRLSSSPMTFFREVSADAKLTIGNFDIPVQKSLLAERSEFFANLFGTELPSEKYPIEGVTMKTLNTLVGYMHCPHQFPKHENVDADLLRGASKFKLQDLFNYCVEVLRSRITVANVVEVYAAAEKFSLDQLKADVNEFITKNVNIIVKTGNLEDFKDYPELMKTLFFEA